MSDWTDEELAAYAAAVHRLDRDPAAFDEKDLRALGRISRAEADRGLALIAQRDGFPKTQVGFLAFILRDLARTTVEYVRGKVAAAVAPLEARVEALESRPLVGVSYSGVWRGDKAFEAGTLVTKRGGLWLVVRPVRAGERPGESDGYLLVVKSGGA